MQIQWGAQVATKADTGLFDVVKPFTISGIVVTLVTTKRPVARVMCVFTQPERYRCDATRHSKWSEHAKAIVL